MILLLFLDGGMNDEASEMTLFLHCVLGLRCARRGTELSSQLPPIFSWNNDMSKNNPHFQTTYMKSFETTLGSPWDHNDPFLKYLEQGDGKASDTRLKRKVK